MSSINPYDSPDDAFNPYMTPKVAPGRPGFGYEAGASSLPFGVGEVFARTWDIFKDQWALCLGTLVACWLICVIAVAIPLVAIGMIGGTTSVVMAPGGGPGGPAANPNDPAALQGMLLLGVATGIAWIGMGIFTFWISIGQALVFMNIARGRTAAFSDIFAGGRFLLPILLASILCSIMTGGAGLLIMTVIAGVASVFGGDQATATTIGVLGMVVGAVGILYVTIRLSQSYFLIIERGAGPLESLRLSVEATRGRVMALVGLILLAYLVNLGGLLACGVGALATFPFTILLAAVAYLSLVGGPVADPAGRGKPYVPGDPLFEL